MHTCQVGILETGAPTEPLRTEYGSYVDMSRHWLSTTIAADYHVYDIQAGDMPARPDQHDLWLITGSPCGVYEEHAWIEPLSAFIRQCRQQSVPMIGICFGHQIIAHALGGVVRKSARGWGVGLHTYATNADQWPQDWPAAPAAWRLQAFHQDQIEQPPEEATVLASSDFCPSALMWYPGFALTIQGHPEFSHDFARALLHSRRGTLVPETRADAALAQRDQRTDSDRLARLCAQVLLPAMQQTVARSD